MAGKLEEAFRSTNGKSSLRPGICGIWSLASQYLKRKYLCKDGPVKPERWRKFQPWRLKIYWNGFPLLLLWTVCSLRRGEGIQGTRENVGKTSKENGWWKSNTGPGWICDATVTHLDHSRSDKLSTSHFAFTVRWSSLSDVEAKIRRLWS